MALLSSRRSECELRLLHQLPRERLFVGVEPCSEDLSFLKLSLGEAFFLKLLPGESPFLKLLSGVAPLLKLLSGVAPLPLGVPLAASSPCPAPAMNHIDVLALDITLLLADWSALRHLLLDILPRILT